MEKKDGVFPIAILSLLTIGVPLLRWSLFLDGYLIKLWITQWGAAALFIYFLFQVLFKAREITIYPAVSCLLLAYLAVNIFSWSMIPLPQRRLAETVLLAGVTYILFFFLAVQYTSQKGAQKKIILLWIFAASVSCIIALSQYLRGWRVIAFLGNENFLAGYLVMTVPLAVGYFWKYRKVNKKIYIAGITAISLYTVVLYLTHSRGGWLGFFCSLLAFWIIIHGPKGKRLLLAVVLVVSAISIMHFPWVKDFIKLQFEGDVRPPIWKGAVNMLALRPWLGWGRGAFFIFYPQFRPQEYWLTDNPTDLTIHAHNEFLHIGAETGLIGLVLFLALVLIVIKKGIRIVDQRTGPGKYLLAGPICALIGLLFHNLVCNNLQMASSAVLFWLLLGMIVTQVPGGRFRLKINRMLSVLIFLAITAITAIIIYQGQMRPMISQFLFKKGWVFRNQNNWEKAIGEYQKALHWYPWDVEMQYRAAYAYTQAGNIDKAINSYGKIINWAPYYGNAHRNLGVLYLKTEQYGPAAQSFLQAMAINEYDAISAYNLARARRLYADK